MKTFPLICLAGILLCIRVSAQSLTREEALKTGHANEGAGNGEFWFEQGDPSPPFRHVGKIVIPQGSAIYLGLGDGRKDLGVNASSDDGSQTRLDFFTSAKGKGWVTAHVLKPEVKSTVEKPQDERPAIHKALSPAARLAVQEGDTDFLEVLLKRGLQVNGALDFESGDTLLHEAVASGGPGLVEFLLKKGAQSDIRNRHGDRPADLAITMGNRDICRLLAKPDGGENKIGDIPAGLIEQVLPHESTKEVFFISWAGEDPSGDVLKEIRRWLPHARPKSAMEALERRPLGASSWYQDKDTHEFGTLIQIRLKKGKDYWDASVRSTVGPSLAGGGWEARIQKRFGYWYSDRKRAWVE